MSKYEYKTTMQGAFVVIDPEGCCVVAAAANGPKGWHLALVEFNGPHLVMVGERVKANKLIHDHEAMDAVVDRLLADADRIAA